MSTIYDIAFNDLDSELAQTRRILEKVPTEHFSFTPHDKSMSLGKLASHVAMLSNFALMMVKAPDTDLAAGMDRPADATDADGLLRLFDESSTALKTALSSAGDERLGETWKLSFGPHVIFEGPRYHGVRRLGISHLVHHRGQLAVYLRLLNVPVPGLYGPSADERGG